jgi:hypothetical protein
MIQVILREIDINFLYIRHKMTSYCSANLPEFTHIVQFMN